MLVVKKPSYSEIHLTGPISTPEEIAAAEMELERRAMDFEVWFDTRHQKGGPRKKIALLRWWNDASDDTGPERDSAENEGLPF